MLQRADFQPITPENKNIIGRYLAKFPQYHSENSLVTILTWSHFAPCTFLEYKEHLIIDCCMEGEHGVHAPIGEPDAKLLDEVLRFAREENCALEIYDEQNLELLQATHPEIPITENRSYFEYLYRAENLANLKGKKYLNIRGQINTFNSRWKYRVEKISEKNLDEVRELVREWSEAKHCEANTIMKEEVSALWHCLENWSKLPVEGITIRIDEDERLGAMAVWEVLQGGHALIHFEKGLLQYPGIYKIVNKETARELFGKVEWINRESDMDVAGLREAKMRYHPEGFVKAYYVLPEDIPDTL